MAKFKIGLTSGTLIDMTNPDGKTGVDVSFRRNKTERNATTGERNVTYAGTTKEDFSLQFTNKTKTQFDTIAGYCNTPIEYWVQIISDNGSVKYFDGWAYLELEQVKKRAETDDFNHDFTVNVKQF